MANFNERRVFFGFPLFIFEANAYLDPPTLEKLRNYGNAKIRSNSKYKESYDKIVEEEKSMRERGGKTEKRDSNSIANNKIERVSS